MGTLDDESMGQGRTTVDRNAVLRQNDPRRDLRGLEKKTMKWDFGVESGHIRE